MRILFCHRPGGAFGYITDSMISALQDMGHTVQRWNGDTDSWQHFQPDIYCGSSGHRQPIPKYRNCKIAIHVNPYGPIDLGSINESPEAINWVFAQKPDVVFGYGAEHDRELWSYWEQRGIPWCPLPTAGDRLQFTLLNETEREYDLVYLGGRWDYKAQTIDKYLLPVFRRTDINYTIRGWGDWPSDIKCKGTLPEQEANIFLNSGKIGPCICEKHTHIYGIDIPERAFKVALCGALIIHDCKAIQKLIPSAIIAEDPKEYSDMCHYYSRPEQNEHRLTVMQQQRREVLTTQTYHHRMVSLIRSLGLEV